MIERIVSGGQTGVDQGALDAAIKLGIAYGGWCPKGRLAENGTIPDHYTLVETDSSDYASRTRRNITDSDAVLIFVPRLPLPIIDGTVLTIDEAKAQAKPFFIVNLAQGVDINAMTQWVRDSEVTILNIAGPRESSYPGIYKTTLSVMENLYLHWQALKVLAGTPSEGRSADVTVFKKYHFAPP